MNNVSDNQEFVYTYVHHNDEDDLCKMEMRSFFGFDTNANALKTTIKIDPSRSPFIKERLELLYEAPSWENLIEQVEQLELADETFKVLSMNTIDLDTTPKIGFERRRKLEREIGLRIPGNPSLDNPKIIFAIMNLNDKWYFGKYEESESVWFRHQNKPHSYSTALSTRVARAVANIAVPNPEGLKVIDPCCGIGNVLVEALSMGIDIVGRDINPLVIEPARVNIAYFGLEGDVQPGPIADVTENYDVAIIDMPYNIFSDATPEDQHDIIRQARRIAKKVIVVTIDTIDHMIEDVGFTIVDRGEAKKGVFVRQVLICE